MKTLLLFFALSIGAVAAGPSLRPAEQAMQVRNYAQAVELLDAYLAEKGSDDEALYLKAISLHEMKQNKQALAVSDQLLDGFEDSPWRHKALFLKSRLLVDEKRFKEAGAIYEAEANRLFSPDRKKSLAEVLIEFGDELTRQPEAEEIAALPADFNKAIELYQKSLELDVGREVRDGVWFKLARCYQELGNGLEAQRRYRQYLAEYDPQWAGPVGSPQRFRGQLRENPLAAGAHWKQARFQLIEVQLASTGQRLQQVPGRRHQALEVPEQAAPHLGALQMARQNAKDLLELLGEEEKALRSDTYWLLVRSYNLPRPAANELERAMKAARDFLAAYPRHPRATDTSRYLALALRHAGRSDEAIEAFADFAAQRNFQFVPQDRQDAGIKTGQSCRETLDHWVQESVYLVGQLRFEQKDYPGAIGQWREYIARFPNGANWSACQQGIIHAEFQVGLDAVGKGQYDLARRQFEGFLKDHPLDSRARQILFTLGQIDVALAEDLEDKHEVADAQLSARIAKHQADAIDQWERLVSKYPNTEESSLALYRIGRIQEEKLGQLEQALASYQRLTWGSAAAKARQRIQTLTRHALTARTARTYRTGEQAFIEVTSRNASKLKFRQYDLNLEAYFRKTHGIGGIEALDIDLIEPDKTWESDVDGYEKYKPITQRIPVPFEGDEPGVCVIRVSEEDFEATTMVIRSDIEILTRTSRRELLVYAQNMVTGKPARGVEVIASNGTEVFGTGTTGRDGVFRKEFFKTLKDAAGIGVFATSRRGIASCNLSLLDLSFSSGLSARGYIYTEKPTYRPGETVHIRGIVRDVEKGSYIVPKQRRYRVRVTDPKGRMLKEVPAKLSRFGAFDGEIRIDPGAPLGSYGIAVVEAGTDSPKSFNGSFQVERYKLEKVKLEFDFEDRVIFRGEIIAATLKANYYWGSPAAGEAIDYTLPDGRTYSALTDEDGQIEIEYDPSGFQPGSQLGFKALAKGYNVAVADHVMLAGLGFGTVVKSMQDVAMAGEPFDVEIRTLDADGEPVGKDLTLYVLRRELPQAEPVLSEVPWLKRPDRPSAEVTVEEHEVVTDAESGVGTCRLALPKGGSYVLRVSGEDRFGQVVTAQDAMIVSDDEDAVKLRLFAESNTGKVGAELPVRLHSRMAKSMALVTLEGEEILSHRVVALKPGFNPLDLTLGHSHFPNFRLSVSAIDGRTLRSASKDFSVERELKMTVTPREDVVAPGEETTVDVQVTDQNGEPVQAAISLAVVNEALFALYQDVAPPILEFFQSAAHRHAKFHMASTCGFSYEGETRKVVKSIAEEKERLERRQNEMKKLAELREQGGYGLGGAMFDQVEQPGASRRGGMRSEGLVSPHSQSFGGAMPTEEADGIGSPLKRLREVEGERAKRDMDGEADAPPRQEVMAASRWISPIVTDASGKAEVRIPMPGSTTEWRLTARGCTVETLVGQAQASIVTRKDFFLELKMPVRLQAGDMMRVLAKLHNLSDYQGEVEVSLRTGGSFRDRQVLRVGAQSSAEVLFGEMEIPTAETLKITARAEGGKLLDRLETNLPIRPWGIELASSDGGMSEGNAVAAVTLPEKHSYRWRELEITVSPSVRQALIDFALQRPGSLPADRLLAAVAAYEYAKAHAAPAEDLEELRKRSRALVASLVATQGEDGQWAWHGSPGIYQTCRSYWALALAEKSGVRLHPDLLRKTEVALNNRFSRLAARDNDHKALILHALSLTGKADFAHLNRIYRERASLSNPALALTAVALVNLDRRDFARDLVEMLEEKVDNQGEDPQPKFANWAGTGHTFLRDPRETTAMALLALARVKPTSPVAQKAANYLLRDRACLRLITPQSQGSAVVALAAYYETIDDAPADFELDVVVNSKRVARLKSSGIGRRRRIEVPQALIRDGENLIRFEQRGRGRYAYSAVLTGFSTNVEKRSAWGRYLTFGKVHDYHGNLSYRGVPLKAASTSPVSQVELGQKIRVLSSVSNHYSDGRREYRVRKEFLPAGMMLVEGSLRGNFKSHEVGDGVITLYYPAGADMSDIHYELVGYAPGTYRVLPPLAYDFYHRDRMAVGLTRSITVLPPGRKSEDPYQLNRHERFELANLNFSDGNYRVALEQLEYLFEHERKHYERDLARMLLWIHTQDAHFEADKVVQMFEILRERHPDLTIPFDKILVVGKAYRLIGEFERAWLVFRATIDSSFVNDASLSATLEDQGQFLGSIDYMDRIWREYPDTSQVVAAYLALSQQLYDKAPRSHELKAERRRGGKDDGGAAPDRIGLLKESLDYLHHFLTYYSSNPLADDAAFSMANAYFALEDYATVVRAAEGFRKVYPKSAFVTSFQYMAALGHFWQYHYQQALAAAEPVTESKSKDRDYARYITAQIHHALGVPGKAIEWYRKVEGLYPDAAAAIGYFEQKRIELDEVTNFKPGEEVMLDMRFRNIREAYLQIYKVDLMKLYLREKNLSNITKVHLAGIEPEFEKTIELGDGRDYRDRERQAILPIAEEGAYLVICRGDDLFTSGMVLVTPLKLEVQESPAAGSLRVNVRDTLDEGYQAKVHVKAIGSNDDEFQSGDTDLRGIFVAEGLNGAATVIAHQDGCYAFYRGETHLGKTPNQPVPQNANGQPTLRQLKSGDYLDNLNRSNIDIQRGQIDNWNQLRRGKGGKGVEIQQVR